MPLSNSYRPTTCILADDLTGACDAAAAFAARSVSTAVRLEPDFSPSKSDVLALSTATRDIPSAQAAAVIEAAAASLDQFPISFKKIDSVFRGNTFVEIAAIVRAMPQRFAVIAPASPRHGRICTDGLLRVRDLTRRSIMSLRPNLAEAGLQPAWLAASNDPARLEAGMRLALETPSPAVFCNAASDLDLAAIVRAASSLGPPILWVGSAGLAHALAASLHPAPIYVPQLPPGALLIFTGSNHAVTTHQLAHLSDHGHAPRILRIERNHTTDDEIRAAIRNIPPRSIGAILLNGGDTALQVCRALAIDTLYLSGEFAPGIPLGLAAGGPFNGSTVILKSGGFGPADLLTQLALSTRQEQPA